MLEEKNICNFVEWGEAEIVLHFFAWIIFYADKFGVVSTEIHLSGQQLKEHV